MASTRTGPLRDAVDWKKFGARVRLEIGHLGRTPRTLAKEWGFPSYVALQAIGRGQPCGVELYLWLCDELHIDPMSVYTQKPPPVVAKASSISARRRSAHRPIPA